MLLSGKTQLGGFADQFSRYSKFNKHDFLRLKSPDAVDSNGARSGPNASVAPFIFSKNISA